MVKLLLTVFDASFLFLNDCFLILKIGFVIKYKIKIFLFIFRKLYENILIEIFL